MRDLLDRNNEQICHKLWEENEHSKSSSWRELAAIEFALEAFLPFIQDSYVKWFTDSQTVFSIIQVGSMKSELHQCSLKKFQIFEICTSQIAEKCTVESAILVFSCCLLREPMLLW